MIRICLLGNSHALALKHALDEDQRRELQLTATFFLAGQDGLLGLAAEGDMLVPTNVELRRQLCKTSRGDGVVRLDQYDAFCICGADNWMWTPYRLFRKCQPYRFRRDKRVPVISETAFCATISDVYSKSVAVHTTRLAKRAAKPVILVPAPMTTIGIAERPGNEWMKEADAAAAVSWLRRIVVSECRAFAHEEGVDVVLQPDHTFAPTGFTKTEYARFYEEDPSKMDSFHMNRRFGVLILEGIAARLRHRLSLETGSESPRQDATVYSVCRLKGTRANNNPGG
jgi:hypothetical protein